MAGKFMAYVLTAVMTLSLALPPVYGSAADAPGQTEAAEQIGTAEQTKAEEQAEPAVQTEAAGTGVEDAGPGFVWQTDIRMSLKRERKLREAAGLSLAAWDEAAAKKKQEGREAPLTKEAVLEANPEAQILDENGAVYYIDGADALGAVGDGYDAAVNYDALKGTKISIAASPTPHADILKVAKEVLAAKDITLDIKEYTDYVQPNNVVESGEVDANYFQHIPYLNDFNKENGTHIVSVLEVHHEPMGVYSATEKNWDNLKK